MCVCTNLRIVTTICGWDVDSLDNSDTIRVHSFILTNYWLLKGGGGGGVLTKLTKYS